jgi:succinylarginine dihydrolase
MGGTVGRVRAAVKHQYAPRTPCGTRVAALGCVTMTTTGKTVGGKVNMTAAALEAALNRALEAHPECDRIRVLKLIRLDNSKVWLTGMPSSRRSSTLRSPQTANVC